jgi:DNA-binding MarR family transcriptional regulator
MSKLVVGVLMYRHIPPPTEAGTTAHDIADGLGLTLRSVQRHLASLERAGLVRREPAPKGRSARWWRS